MKKAKQFIISSTFALFLSSSVLNTNAAPTPAQWNEQAESTAKVFNRTAYQNVTSTKKNWHQKKMRYKQLAREKRERRINS